MHCVTGDFPKITESGNKTNSRISTKGGACCADQWAYHCLAVDTQYRREGRKQVAADFGIGFSTLSRWVRQDRVTLPEPSVQSDLEREVAMLRKENRLLREEREVLKKATIH